MANDYFNQNSNIRSGRNDFLGDAHTNTIHVSVAKTPVRQNPPPKSTPTRDRGGTGGRDGGRGGRGAKAGWRGIPVALAIVIDILIAGLVFLVFFFMEFSDIADAGDSTPSSSSVSIVSVSPANPSATPSISSLPTPSAGMTATIDPNSWRAKFADKFSADGQVHQQTNADSWIYQSPNISVTVTKHTEGKTVYFVTDIYIADIKYFRTWYGYVPNEQKTRKYVVDALQEVGGVVGINGDYYERNGGLTIRNGQYITYKDSKLDELVMYNDGTMQVFANRDFDRESIKAQAPDVVYQVWGFGPMLLDANGNQLEEFNSTVNPENPRAAIGYYEPGHYCFLTLDGRQPGYSRGYSLKQLAQLMHDLGCRLAFNLDGGASSQLAFMGSEINSPCEGRRPDYDIIYITDQD